jgi:predicted enzyme related to lactoylglutathione lyase
MNQGIQTIIYPVKDKDTARELFTKLLGVEPYTDGAYYVGFKIRDQEIGLDPNGHQQGLTGPVGYHHVTDIKKSVQILLEAGGHVQQAVKDVGGGKLIAIVKDSDGNMIGFIQMS